MKPETWFKEKIGTIIYRGTTPIEVTEDNFKRLFVLQDSANGYVFTLKP